MSSSLVQRLKSIGPGALVAAGFIGPRHRHNLHRIRR